MIELNIRLEGELPVAKLRKADEAAFRFVRGELSGRVRKRALRELRRAPRPNSAADYPLVWRSERQRRYVMAKLRRAWALIARRDGRASVLEVKHPGRVVDFVMGRAPYRQPMFPRWQTYQDILEREVVKIERDVRAWWGGYLR
jgi:hypothetical protein